MTFTEKLRRLMEDRNCARVAKRMGLPRNAISDYINKKMIPRADRAAQIARAMGVSLDWLMNDAVGWPPVRVDVQEECPVA